MRPIIQSVREYMMRFPQLKDGSLTVDYLGGSPTEYTVEAVPCEPVYKRYTDGSCIRQFLFIFASREFYGADVEMNTSNLSFYEELEEWIYKQNFNDILPDLGDSRTAIDLEVLTGGYVIDADTNTARYQLQLRLLYEEK